MQISSKANARVRAVLVGVLAGAGAALLVGIPTDVIPNPVFYRMTPVRGQDYLFLLLTAVMIGVVVATYMLPATRCSVSPGRTTVAGFLSYLAVGCPVCNKVVLLLLGTSGAMAYWAPVQPALGAASIALLAGTLWLRIRGLRAPSSAVLPAADLDS